MDARSGMARVGSRVRCAAPESRRAPAGTSVRIRRRRRLTAPLIATATTLLTVLGLTTGAVPAANAVAPAQLPIRQAAASGLLRAGLRISYNSGDAVREGARLVPDPNGPLEKDGQRYSVGGSGGSGGVGIEQVDIVHADQSSVVGDVRFYLAANETLSAYAAGGLSVAQGDTNKLDPYWVSPTTLAGLTPGATAGVRISRSTVTILNQQVNAVTYVQFSSTSYASSTYDLESGLLLASGTMNANSGVQIVDPSGNPMDNMSGSVATSHKLLVGLRILPSAIYGGVPAGASPGTVSFRGQRSSPGVAGMPDLTQALSLDMTCDRLVGDVYIGRQIITADTGTGIAAPPSESQTVYYAAVDKLWLPEGLRQTPAGTTLDTDQITGHTVSVVSNDGSQIVIGMTSPIEAWQSTFDLSTGMLVGYVIQDQQTGVGLVTVQIQRTN